MTSRTTILDLDLRKILSKLEQRYEVKLPRTVLAVDYGEHNDLYIRFRHVERPVGEPSNDGLVVFFYEDHGDHAVAVEILELSQLFQ
jgi:hypothetical protein